MTLVHTHIIEGYINTDIRHWLVISIKRNVATDSVSECVLIAKMATGLYTGVSDHQWRMKVNHILNKV